MYKLLLAGALCVSASCFAEAPRSDVANIQNIMQTKFSKPVFVRPLMNTSLFVVVIDNEVMFTDQTGSVLLNGDVLTLSDNVVISNVVREEFAALKRKQEIIDASTVNDVSSFLVSPPSSKKRETRTPVASAPATMPEIDTKIALAHDEYNDVSERRQCINKLADSKSLGDFYRAFTKMDNSERDFCRQVFASATIPEMNDESMLVYKADNEKNVLTMFSDYTCIYCNRDHKNIRQLNDQGVTVRIYPFGRANYQVIENSKEGKPQYTNQYTTMGKNYVATQCAYNDPEKSKLLFDELMSNPRKYASSTLPDVAKVDFTSDCAFKAVQQKLYGDLYTSRITPMYVFDNGKVNVGSLNVSQILNKFN